MASKNLRLDVLHAQGDITVTNSDALDSSYNTIADVFDSNNTDTSMIVLENNENPAHTLITINNNQPKLANRIVISVGTVLTGRVIINEGQTDQLILNWDTGRTSYNLAPKTLTLNFPGEISSVSSIKILYDTFDESHHEPLQNDVRLYGVQLFGKMLYYAEFNDAVLDTTAWNSSRYGGRQLTGSKINKYNTGDISYAGTPILRNNCRTFYIANEIISLSGSGFTPNSVEDDTLHRIPGFSYLTVNRAITVNGDDTITLTDINTFSDGDIDPNTGLTYSAQGRGFDREFRSNIPIGSRINLRTLDDNVKQRSLRALDVFFNEGRLRQLFIYGNANMGDGSGGTHLGTNTTSDTNWQLYRAVSSTTILSGSLFIKDNARTLTGKFYTGSIPTGFGQSTEGFAQFLNALDIFKEDQQTAQDRRIFITALKGIISASDSTLYGDIPSNFVYNFSYGLSSGDGTNIKDLYGEEGSISTNLVFRGEVLNTNISESIVSLTTDLEQLSTFEISSIESAPAQGAANLKKGHMQINNIYGSRRIQKPSFGKARKYDYEADSGDLVGEGNPEETGKAIRSEGLYGGSYSVSILDTSIPSLLVNLNKELEYPEGKGNKPLLVLPDTLHPFVKDNLIHFIAQAGFDIGDRRVVPEIDETNRNLS
jgi:hypothetical protein